MRRTGFVGLAIGTSLAAACGGSEKNAPPRSVAPSVSSTVAVASSTSASTLASATTPLPPVDPDVPSGDDAKRDAILAKDARAIYGAFLDGNPRVTADGTSLVFASNRDGLSQLYVAAAQKPEAPARRLVTLTERIGAYTLSPDGKSVVFASDQGANENWSYFQVGIDGSSLVELTKDGPLHRDDPIVVGGAPDRVFYSAHKKEEGSTSIYVVDRTGKGTPTLLFAEPYSEFLVDVSPDGKAGLMIRWRSYSDAQLVIASLSPVLAEKRDAVIYPAPSKTANVVHARFSADGKRVFVATDAGGEEGLLLALDPQTGEEKARYVETSPKTAFIDEIDVAKNGGRLAAIVDAGNHSELRVLDATTLKAIVTPKMPLGTGSLPRFSDDGKTIYAAWSTPNAPRDLYAIDAKSGVAKLARKEARPSLAGLDEIEATLASVKSFDGMDVPVNVYRPKGLAAGKKLPVIVSVHGGPAGSDHVRWSTFNRFFLSHGFLVVEPNVRGSTGFGRAYEQADDGPKRIDAVRDLEEVGKWVDAQPWADPERLIVMGGSYGGYMTLMGVTHHPKLWKAGVDLFGIYAWKSFMKSTAGLIHDLFQREIGKDEDVAFLDSISPSSAIDAAVAPLFVYAGENDPRVPRSESDAIVKRLRERNVPVEYMVAGDEGHSLDHEANVVELLARSTRFLEKELKIAPP